jgi:hypothetical protein
MSDSENNRIPPDHPLAHLAHLAHPPGPATLAQEEQPPGFEYPRSFMAHLAQHPRMSVELRPWHAEPGDGGFDRRLSERLGRPVVMFAKADFEDMVACFVVGTGEESKVVVVNPWLEKLIDGQWQQTCKVLHELSNFEQWVQWALNSPEVRHQAEGREQP